MLEKIKGDITSEIKIELSDFFSAPVLNNEVSALEQDIKLKTFEDAITDARKKIKDKVIEESVGRKACLGVSFTIANGGQTLSYDDDLEYRRLKELLDSRSKLLKQAWELSQSNPDSQLVIDGELIPVVSVKSHTASSIRYKFV